MYSGGQYEHSSVNDVVHVHYLEEQKGGEGGRDKRAREYGTTCIYMYMQYNHVHVYVTTPYLHVLMTLRKCACYTHVHIHVHT